MTRVPQLPASLAYTGRSKGVVLLTCLIILCLLAIMAISGMDRALVNLRLTNNMKLRQHSFILAETALELALQKATDNPVLLAPVTSLIARRSSGMESFRVYSIYRGSGGPCDKNPSSIAHHYELIAIANVGQHANANHAIGVTVCEQPALNVAGEPEVIVALSRPNRTFWHMVDKQAADLLLQ